jgi:hypothetical protein
MLILDFHQSSAALLAIEKQKQKHTRRYHQLHHPAIANIPPLFPVQITKPFEVRGIIIQNKSIQTETK